VLVLTTALLPLRIAHADMIATTASADRAAPAQYISRSEVRRQLVALGADPVFVGTAPAGGNAGPGFATRD
jgi:hypothetical protein